MLLTAVLGVTTSIAAAHPKERAVNVVMEDQFRNRRETGSLHGDVVVLVYAERKGGEASQELGRKLHVHFHPQAAQVSAMEWGRQPVAGLPDWPTDVRIPDVHAVAVACLSEIPRPLHPVARAQFRKDSPHVPVWLDFTSTMKQTFGIVPGTPNVALIDTQGQVHSVLSGRFDEIKFRELVTTIDQLRQQARSAQRQATPVNVTR